MPIFLNYWNFQSKPRPFSPQGLGCLPLQGVRKRAPAPVHCPWRSTAWAWRPQQNVGAGASPSPWERKRETRKNLAGTHPGPGTAGWNMAETQPMDGAEGKQPQDTGKLNFCPPAPSSPPLFFPLLFLSFSLSPYFFLPLLPFFFFNFLPSFPFSFPFYPIFLFTFFSSSFIYLIYLPFSFSFFPVISFSLLSFSSLPSVAITERWGLHRRARRERAGWERKYILRHFHYSTWWELIKILNWK